MTHEFLFLSSVVFLIQLAIHKDFVGTVLLSLVFMVAEGGSFEEHIFQSTVSTPNTTYVSATFMLHGITLL